LFIAENPEKYADTEHEIAMDDKWRRKQNTRLELYLIASRGDHLMLSFECDLCIFRKLCDQHQPDPHSHVDTRFMLTIPGMNLDALWSRASSTVTVNSSVMDRGLQHYKALGLTGPYLEMGPLPYYDHCGYEVALKFLTDSRERGNYQITQKQFDMIRNLRPAYSNQVRASGRAARHPMALEENQGKNYTWIALYPMASIWFSRFIKGCKRRMGQDCQPSRGISTDIITAALVMYLIVFEEAMVPSLKRAWVKAGFYLAASYITSLRGPEGRLLDLESMWSQRNLHPTSTVIALRGNIKGETSARAHLLPCVHVISSGIDLKMWMEMCLLANHEEGRSNCPAISNAEGFVMLASELDDVLHVSLIRVLEVQPSLLPTDISTPLDIPAKIQTFRSICRSSNSWALNQSIPKSYVDTVNLWAQQERAGARKASLALNEYYAQVEELTPAFHAYTYGM
jgi:hypothetical protein